MTEKILVAYASRTGATKEIAEAIGKSLVDGGADVDIRSMTEIKDLSPYSAVVAGSAIRGSKWLPEAMEFMRLHQADLKEDTVCGIHGLHHPGDEKRRKLSTRHPGLDEPGAQHGAPGQRGLLCWQAGFFQNAVFI